MLIFIYSVKTVNRNNYYYYIISNIITVSNLLRNNIERVCYSLKLSLIYIHIGYIYTIKAFVAIISVVLRKKIAILYY